jgi:hypothetical protein
VAAVSACSDVLVVYSVTVVTYDRKMFIALTLIECTKYRIGLPSIKWEKERKKERERERERERKREKCILRNCLESMVVMEEEMSMKKPQRGATTFSMMTLSVKTLSTTTSIMTPI